MEKQQQNEQESPNIHSEHVKEEFYKWFESRGLLSDLRAYMRQLMVKALENSNKNSKTNWQRKVASSPKLQAINLLMVDYLFHEQYLYTVSVFASEAQILDSLPQYSQYITQTVRERHWEPSSLPRFSQQETEDILDTLRLLPTRQQVHQATQMYLSGQESLLTSVVRALTSSHSYSNELGHCLDVEVNTNHVEYNYQLWSKEMEELLLLAGVKIQHIRRMQQKWTQTIEEERQKAKQEAEEEYLNQQTEWQERLRAELLEEMHTEQQLLTNRQHELESRELGLRDLAQQLTSVHEDISERLSQLKIQREELEDIEARQENDRIQLGDRFSQLHVREEQLQQNITSFQEKVDEATSQNKEEERVISQNPINYLKLELENKEKQIMTKEASVQIVSDPGCPVYTQTSHPAETVSTQTLETVDHEQQTSSCQPDPELLLQLQSDRDKINELQEENLELRAHALQQRHRIDELTNRAASLVSQLEDSRVAVEVLSGREGAVVVAPPPPPAQPSTPVFIAPAFGFNSPQRIGAGEESLFVPRPQQATPRVDGRKRPLRFAFSQNPSPTSEESSPTDEVIQNARARIQQLEEESATIQRNYQQFQTRLLTSDSVMFPALNTPRIHDPVMRVRRNNLILPATHFQHVPYPSLTLFHPQQPREIHPRDEENENDSSSDAPRTYEVDRIENIIHSRRIFTQRNLKQFERWKQFKKKYQKRDALTHRRNLNVALNSNTSSEEDEVNIRHTRRKNESNKFRNINSQNSQVKKKLESIVKNKGNKTLPKDQEETSTLIFPALNKQKHKPEDSRLSITPNIVTVPEEASISKTKLIIDKKEEDKLRIELERSVKLIESVKLLLGAQNSTLSNGSLAVESLPRDSQLESQNEVGKTDSSVLMMQSSNPAVSTENKSEQSIIKDTEDSMQTTVKPSNTRDNENIVSSDNKSVVTEVKRTMSDKEELGYEISENREAPEPLSIPTLRLVSPGLNVTSEDFMGTAVAPSSDLVERESGGDVATSVTSGSDILRELNPSKTQSSDSVISTGWAEDSKHSSDFWN